MDCRLELALLQHRVSARTALKMHATSYLLVAGTHVYYAFSCEHERGCPHCYLQAQHEQATEEEDLSADEILLLRMDAGLYTLQQCALIIGNLWIVGDQLVKQRILMLLHQQVYCQAFVTWPETSAVAITMPRIWLISSLWQSPKL